MTDQPLFPFEKRRRPKASRDPAVGLATTRLMLRVYTPLHRDRFGEDPQVGGREWGTMQRLVKQFGAETVEARLRVFMAWDDPWVTQKGHALWVFERKWEEVRARAERMAGGTSSRCTHAPRCPTDAAHSKKLVDELKTPF